MKRLMVGDIIGRNGTGEKTKIIKTKGWCFWTANNWVGGGNLCEGGNDKVFFIVKRPWYNKLIAWIIN